jgi:fimbrial isopeptide formation D2 family protein/uncharacterized repeat protein (TIGR01451 family)
MSLRANPFRAIPITLAFLLNVVIGPLAPIAQIASAPVMALSGSDFNVTDANLTDDSASELDWCTNGVSVITKDDLPTGQTDNAYKGAKENELNPEVDFGSIPNNKVDLQRLYISSETTGSGDLLVYVGWIRNDTTGTGTISFEMNQSDVVLSNGINHQRTIGDLLIEFNFQANPGSQGGYDVDLTYRSWEGDAWSDADDLGSLAEGSVNPAPITDCRNGNAALGTGQFGEFALNLTDLIGGQCRAFGSIFAKSRSSEQITSELKEVMAPVPVDFSTCGQITILKRDENGDPLGGATFSVTPNPFTGSGSLEIKDNDGNDDNDDAGVIHLSNVEPDEYQVCETKAPAGYILDETCVTKTVAQNGHAQFGPFINGLGAISWQKVDEQSGDKICCATFTLAGIDGAADGFGPLTVVDNGQHDADNDPGELRVSGLLLGTYRITETVAPTGYDLPDPAYKDVVLDDESAAPAHAFQDAPRRDPRVKKTAVLDTVQAGSPASFDIVVTAGGVGDSENVELTDENPADSGKTWTVSGADKADCADLSIAPGESLSCDFGTIDNGDHRSVTITMSTSKSDCADGIENTARITADNDVDTSNNESSASIAVECPGLNINKVADDDAIDAGEVASYTIVIWNAGPGTAFDASWSDDLPDGVSWSIDLVNPDNDDSCISGVDQSGHQSASCQFGDLGASAKPTRPYGESSPGKVIVVSGRTDRADCGTLDNTAFASASNGDTVHSSASITVSCPTVAIEKSNDQSAPVLPGTGVKYTLDVTVGGGQASDVVVTDKLPAGLDAPTGISNGGDYDASSRTITWNLGDLDSGSYQLTYHAAVSLDAEQGDELVNLAVVTSPNSQCPDAKNLADECDDDSIVTVRVAILVIDKAADTEIVHFVFDKDGNVKSVDPEQVTWTLTYTLTHGPVTDAVITDPLPEFLEFVSASDGGAYDSATRTITWELGDLTVDGSDSVSFVTTVDPDAPETGPIVNMASIVSNETPKDEGQDSIRVTSESLQGGQSTPKPSVPNTALAFGPAGEPISIPVELMVVVFFGSLGALAFANVRAVRRRRR